MKRDNHLLEQIADPENLRLAFWKARKGKTGKIEVQKYRDQLDKHLEILRNQILAGEVLVGKYHYFTIYDPKERRICAAPFSERVLHHALMNVCHASFERYQIYHSYATRINKGTYAAINQAWNNQKQFKWFLKLDVRKYFDSIDHQVLKELLKRRFKEAKLLTIFCSIIDSYQTKPGKGVPIGNLTSQYFANHYLALADHTVLEKMHIPAYVRYMDDMVLWANSKEELLQIGSLFTNFIVQELHLVLKPFCLNKTEKGLPFCGYLLFPTHKRLNRTSKKRFVAKSKQYEQLLSIGEWDQQTYQQHIIPLLAFTRHAKTVGFRKNLFYSSNRV
ncbi:MAG: RNA-directed DNA polymerase [Bacteroidetes bacterium]|nr:RNA-directed DNA polymerase [Bacteroidota bacterium]